MLLPVWRQFSSDRIYVDLRNITGLFPENLALYHQAFRHHSVSEKINDSGYKNSNERLEYLGDSILNSIIAEYLFLKFPYKNEGFLTEMRSKIVSRESLNNLAIRMGIDKLIRYDAKAYENSLNKKVIYGNALEALIGAVYLDHGFILTKKFVFRRILSHIDVDKLETLESNFKGRLLEWAQRNSKELEFEVIQEKIVRKQKLYKVGVFVDKKELSTGEDFSKKKAEQIAAEKACAELKVFDV